MVRIRDGYRNSVPPWAKVDPATISTKLQMCPEHGVQMVLKTASMMCPQCYAGKKWMARKCIKCKTVFLTYVRHQKYCNAPCRS